MDCHQKHLYLHQELTAVSKLTIDYQMFGFLFLAHKYCRCLLISFNLHSASEFLDGRGLVDLVDEVDHHKYLFLLLLTGLWSSSFSSKQLLILLTADPSPQRPWPLLQLLPVSLIRILSAMTLSLVHELLDCDLLYFDEDLLECDLFPNKNCLDSLSSDTSPCFNQLRNLCCFHLVFQNKLHLPLV